jgi:hypothetical protein
VCTLWQEWSRQRLNAMGRLVAEIVVETPQNAGVTRAILHGRGGDVREMVRENFL